MLTDVYLGYACKSLIISDVYNVYDVNAYIMAIDCLPIGIKKRTTNDHALPLLCSLFVWYGVLRNQVDIVLLNQFIVVKAIREFRTGLLNIMGVASLVRFGFIL